MLGHATVAFTLDVYSHVTETLRREAARTVDALLGGEDDRVGVRAGVEPGEQTTLDPVGSSKCKYDSTVGEAGFEPAT